MNGSTLDAVVAGTKPFAVALLAPLTTRVGTRPRIAADPVQALALCAPNGLAVVEYAGAASLPAIERLVKQGALRVVAGVPAEHAAAEPALRALGVEPALWDGRPDAILDAVERILASAAGAAPAAAPATPPAFPPGHAPGVTPPPIPPAAPTASPSRPAASFFDDLTDDEFEIDTDDVAPVALAAPPPVDDRPWPLCAPDDAEAQAALAAGLAGTLAPTAPLAAVVAQVSSCLSELERAVLAGEPQPIDAAPVRRAAVMRVRVAAALASTPSPEVGADAAGVSSLLGEMDALLSAVGTALQSAPEEFQAQLETIRNALVKEAIDFSEAAQRVASPTAETACAPAPRREVARVLSVPADAAEPAERGRGIYVALALALVGAAAFHGWNWYQDREAARRIPPPAFPGIPAGASGISSGSARLIASQGGAPLAPADVDAFRAQEEAAGRHVRQLAPGTVISLPDAPKQGVTP
jgi:hypothetical protein